MITTPSADTPARRVWDALLALLVALAALLPRVLDLGGFITVDEANFWLTRSAVFLDALRRGDWAATAISTHPGVTTMWLGSFGLLLREALVGTGRLPGDFATALMLMRLPAALVHTAGVLLGYALLRRLASPATAILAALLWAADPFVIAYSRLLHVDGLAGTFITLSVLAALVAAERRGTSGAGRGALALSGLFAGLALLSKSPSLILFPVIGAIAIWPWLTGRRGGAEQLRNDITDLLIWAATAAATCVALWPALWVDPLGALQWLRTGVEAEGAQPHMLGNFFLGRQDDAPGPLFYPVAIALRLTPLTLAGLLLLPLGLRGLPREQRHTLALLALLALLLTAGLSVYPKKFNRYIEPAFPALDVLAAAGITGSAAWAAGRLRGSGAGRALGGVVATVGGLACLNAALWHPYSIAAFNQALGGAPAGARTFVAGWGEGYEQVAEWLNQQPDISGVSAVSRFPVVQAPYMHHGAYARTPQAGALPQGTGYLTVYLSQVQRGAPSPPFDAFYGRATPLHTVVIHGVAYAWTYQVPPPVDDLRPAAFGDAIALRGYSWATPPQPGATATLVLRWEARAAPAADYMLFAHLIGPDGQRVGQVDLPLASAGWQPGRYPGTELPLAVPSGRPGTYRVLIGLYDPATQQRLPLRTDLPVDPSLSGADALTLATFEIR